MVTLEQMRASNARIPEALPAGLVAVFAGGTSGIGETTMKQFARHTVSPRIFFIGRSDRAAARLHTELMEINPAGKYRFIRSDLSLLQNVDEVSRQIKTKESAINLLFLTSGTMITGRDTFESIYYPTALNYYSRIRLIANLLPLLQKATSLRRVVTVFGGTKEGPITTDDLPGRGLAALPLRGHTASMMTLALESLALEAPDVGGRETAAEVRQFPPQRQKTEPKLKVFAGGWKLHAEFETRADNMNSRDDAKKAVDSIGRKFGFVGDDIMGQIEQWRPDIRRIIEESMLAKDRLAAHSIKTLAKNIYGSDARFVFELLQNADDNRFRRAIKRGDVPSISFLIHPNRIVVECNEDGFTKEDLSAVCAVGESTKSASHGYIGAKGIGFKSVFIAAWMVHIQSGYFSFFFRHEKGDSGLGMVLPVWKDAEEELPGPLTRMTLHLHQKGDQNELQHLRETIFQQLNDLQETCLLFLGKLKRICVSFYHDDGGLKSTKVFSVGTVDEHRVFLKTRSRQGNGPWLENKKYYHVTKHTASNLSRSVNREIPDTEEARRSSSTAEVVLAFPLTMDYKPHIEKQHVFAFLPIRESSFTINDVKLLTLVARDSENNPLFDDPISDPFLSDAYPSASRTFLEPYGLVSADHQMLLDLLQADLYKLDSKMKSSSTSQGWHSAVARITIPPGVDIPVIDPGAVSNHDRRTLFTHLGVIESSVAGVRNAIVKAYETNDGRVDMAESRAHLHYLYLTSQHNQTQIGSGGIYVWNHWTQYADLRRLDVFLPSDHPYGPDALLQPAGDAPGLAVAFLHPTYLKDVPQSLATSNLSWERWLVDFLGVRDRLRLVSRSRDSLSPTWFYVAKHRPEKLLGLLEHLWRHEGSRYIGGNNSLKAEVRGMSADMLCGLRQYLRFMEGSEPFPFLKLEETMAAEQLSAKWMFLNTNFSVGWAEDTDFFLDILRWIHRAKPDAPSLKRPQRVLDLYLAIDAKCLGAADLRAERKRVRDTFASVKEQWAELSVCRWKGPPNMTTKISLEPAYTQEYGLDQTALLSPFFQKTLSIQGVSWKDVAFELAEMKRDGDYDFEGILGLYRYMSDLRIIAFIDELRKKFETERLIFAFKNKEPGWYKTSECLWSSTAEIRGMVTLNDHYDELRDFFVDTLGVKTLTLRMVYDELCNISPQRGVDEIKNIIWSLNALLQTEPDLLDPGPLRKAHIFPVRYPNGGVSLLSADTEFAIIDRDHLAARFRDCIKLLDYTLEDVRRLKPFLQWSELEQRYLSASVKEITSFQGGPTRPISMPNRNLNRKAHALLRPRYCSAPATLQHLFRTIQVRETDGISSELSISQDGRAVSVQEAVGNLYISTPLSSENTSSFAGGARSSNLIIYVPANKTEQNFCFGSPLPASLARWLMTDPTTQIEDAVDSALITALTTLLAVDGAVVDRVLEHQGIVQLPPFEEDFETGGEDGREQVMGEEEEEEEDDSAETRDGDTLSSHCGAGRGFPPSRSAFDMSGLRDTLPGVDFAGFDGLDTVDRFRSSSRLERDKKIGAAGELYAFEILSRLNPSLPNWGWHNWPSTMRGYVRVHPDYADMPAWSGRETADITYDDAAGNLTAMLIDRGYLEREEWWDARPRYFIEVKSTTGPCAMPFFMSKHQYQRTGILKCT
ncbi:hypothetical protein N0V88_007854 [Collariella sp. IMI 366227]|nr:hypothetical protein N0V88_007854 [Collariella sp. IMI 366227]